VTNDAEAMTVVLRARQFCDSPALLDLAPKEGAKLVCALEILDEAISLGHKILIFSMFEKMVKIICECCDDRGWNYSKITGEVTPSERFEIARRFNEDSSVDLCVMDEAGSTGLNFQKASYVIHYDDNWSPAIMKQRTDRAHRLTTRQPVTVINLVCCDTVEERRVRAIINKKDGISAAALGDDFQDVAALGPPLSRKELMKLL
jgi:SNF2 family DNA or RNA helicase